MRLLVQVMRLALMKTHKTASCLGVGTQISTGRSRARYSAGVGVWTRSGLRAS